MPDAEEFSIGTVSRLTGIAPHTLRVWERRYSVVDSRRSEGGQRRYSNEDVEKLTLLKALVDRGDRIGNIAGEDIETLRSRLASVEDHTRTSRETARGPRNIAVFGSTLAGSLEDTPLPGARVTLAETELERFLTDGALASADAVILEFALLTPETLDKVNEISAAAGPARIIVVYGFGRTSDVERLVNSGVMVLRSPADLHAVAALAGLPSGHAESPAGAESERPREISPPAMEIPPRQLSANALQRLARASTTVDCECPHHLVDLVRSLTAFELYSRQCRNRNEKDAALHAYLHVTTAQARALMEEACIRAAEADGIEI